MDQPIGSPQCGRLKLNVLGEFQLRDATGSLLLDDRDGRKTTVLKYLACHPDGMRSIKDLAEALWPESTDSSAQGNLRVAFYKLKTCLRSTANNLPLRIAGGMVALDRDAIDVDAWDAERAAQRILSGDHSLVDLCEALAIFNRDLLPGEVYADWTSRYRMRIAALHRSLLLHTLRELRQQSVDLKTARMIDRFAYDFARQDPGDLDIVPEFIRYLAACNRLTEAQELRRCFLEQDGDASLLPDLQTESAVVELPSAISVKPRDPAYLTGIDTAHARVLNVTLTSLLDGVGQIVVLDGADRRNGSPTVQHALSEAERRGVIVCKVAHGEEPFLHRCAFALERVCASLRFDRTQLATVDAEIARLLEACTILRTGGASDDELRALPYRLTVAIRAIVRHVPFLVIIEGGERLDTSGADLLAQLFLLARWYGLFVLVRMNLGSSSSSPALHLIEAVRSSVQFVSIDDAEAAEPVTAVKLRRRPIVRAFHGVSRLTRFSQLGA